MQERIEEQEALTVARALAKDWRDLADQSVGVSDGYREALRYCAKKLERAIGVPQPPPPPPPPP
jgi:hypothetical protein